MPMPSDIRVIDLMMGTQAGAAAKAQYESLRRAAHDRESKEFAFPAQYMFKDVPFSEQARGVATLTEEEPQQGADLLLPFMDRCGVERAMIGVSPTREAAQDALRRYPDRFFGSFEIDPNKGMDGVRALVGMHDEWGIKAATAFPCGYQPQVPINDKKMYPFYAKCVELDIPICICAGVPGPRVPMAPQRVELLDEVCYDFPELRVVTRHGCEPWTALAVKLMLKWPNLYYSTSAFAPKHYPKDIVDFANTRGDDKVMYAGYFPMGLSLDRIFEEMPGVPFRDHVWPKFLRENALRVFNLPS
jgi:predicted TIM-barrel fold metal-dependent hydrolase